MSPAPVNAESRPDPDLASPSPLSSGTDAGATRVDLMRWLMLASDPASGDEPLDTMALIFGDCSAAAPSSVLNTRTGTFPDEIPDRLMYLDVLYTPGRSSWSRRLLISFHLFASLTSAFHSTSPAGTAHHTPHTVSQATKGRAS